MQETRSSGSASIIPIPMEKDHRRRSDDAGAAFVLESKGTWWHAGFHLTTAIVGPTILTLPYALRGMGWALGLFSLTAVAFVTFYAYLLMSKVLDRCEDEGRRHIRFRELASDVLGSGWMFYFVVCIQTAINAGVGIGCILLAGECVKIMYSNISPEGPLKLYHFIMIVTTLLILLSQMPSFHSLRYINLVSLLLALGYTFLMVAGCIGAGNSKDAPPKDYSLDSSNSVKTFNVFTSISILASVFGNGILPEIQATMAPPASGKMVKALMLCYSVIFITFYSASISGYWAFGNKVNSNILKSLLPDVGPALAPTWLLGLAVIFVLLQLLAIDLVYSQVAYEIMEKSSADVNEGKFSKRNLVPRLILRTSYMTFCGFMAAMLPFFGDIVGVVGAIGFIPLDFILPMLLYNVAIKPPKNSIIFCFNVFIMVVFTCVGLMGAFSSAHVSGISDVVWIPPEFGDAIACIFSDGTLSLWEEVEEDSQPLTWRQCKVFEGSNSRALSLQFGGFGTSLKMVAAYSDGHVKVYELSDPLELTKWQLQAEFQNVIDSVSRYGKPSCLSASVAWNPHKGERQQSSFVLGYNSDISQFNLPKIWEFDMSHQRWLAIAELALPADGDGDRVHAIAWAPNIGRPYEVIAVATCKGITIWHLGRDHEADGRLPMDKVALLSGHDGEVWQLEWDMGGMTLASTGDDGMVRLWQSDLNGVWHEQAALECNGVQP